MSDEIAGQDPFKREAKNNELTPQSEKELLERIVASSPEDFSQEDRQNVARITSVAQSKSGPLPSAEEMAAYKKVDPELPGQIFDMSRTEQLHRHRLESGDQELTYEAVRKDQEYRRKAVKLGQVLGFLIAVFVSSARSSNRASEDKKIQNHS